MTMIASVALLLLEGAAAAPPPPDVEPNRFSVSANWTPAPAHSEDGRFEAQVTARVGGLDDNRFAIISTAASCAADDIFNNGFD
jgi:hypothetical protein